MLARIQCCGGQFVMGQDGRHDCHGVEVGVIEQLVVGIRDASLRVPQSRSLERVRGVVAKPRELCPGARSHVACDVGTPVAESDDTDACSVVAVHVVEPPRKSVKGVRASSHRSRRSDQFRAYAASRSSASFRVARARAVTCQRPVIPAGTRKRSK